MEETVPQPAVIQPVMRPVIQRLNKKQYVQIECNSLEPATVYWKAYWNHLLIPRSHQNTVLDRKWKKLMKKSALSKGSVLLLRSIVLHFTFFREFGLDYDCPALPKT